MELSPGGRERPMSGHWSSSRRAAQPPTAPHSEAVQPAPVACPATGQHGGPLLLRLRVRGHRLPGNLILAVPPSFPDTAACVRFTDLW